MKETSLIRSPDVPPSTRSLVRSSGGTLITRGRLSETRLGVGMVRGADPSAAERDTLVTRQHKLSRLRRRRRILTGVVLFPGFWPFSLAGWLVWRQKAKPKSMRQVRKAVRALENDQSGVALKRLQDAHLLDPSNCDALYWMGLLLNRLGRQPEAIEALSLVAERVPGLPEVESALVDAYVNTDEPESAIYHAQRLLDVNPHSNETLLQLARAFECAGKNDLAIQALEQAPLHVRTLTDGLVQIHYRLGILHEKEGDAQKALSHFKRVYARDIAYRDVRERVEALES